jgi:hypothetical protein
MEKSFLAPVYSVEMIGRIRRRRMKNTMKLSFLIGIFVLLLLTSCTARFIYNYLDWIIPWYVSDYISLNNDQDNYLDQLLREQLRWHRTTQLSEYSQFLRQLSEALKVGLTREDLDRFHDTLRHFWQDLVRHISPDVAKILGSASEDQIKELLENLENRSQRFKEDYIDMPAEELRLKKLKRMRRFLGYWIGDLDSRQEQIIERWSYELKIMGPARLKYIEQWRERFKKILENRRNEAQFAEALKNSLFFRRKEWPIDFKQKAAYNRDLTKRVFLKIDRNMSNRQRQRFIEKLESLAEQLDELAKEQD